MVNIHFLSILRLHITDSVTRSNTGESACRLSWQTQQFFSKPSVSLKQLLTTDRTSSFCLLKNDVSVQNQIQKCMGFMLNTIKNSFKPQWMYLWEKEQQFHFEADLQGKPYGRSASSPTETISNEH